MSTSPSRSNARHEAAHAVVAVRVGLPLLFCDIRRREVGPAGSEYVLYSVGFTGLDAAVLEAMLSDPVSGKDACLHRATFAAAGIVPELERGARPDDPSFQDDIEGVMHYADRLGRTDHAVFLAECIKRASTLLKADDGVAWDRVTAALLRHRELTGRRVREIVGV